MEASAEEIGTIEGIGPVIARNVEEFFRDGEKRQRVERLMKEVILEKRKFQTKERFLKI